MVLTHQQVYGSSVSLPQHFLILPLAQTLAKLNQGGIMDDITMSQWAFCLCTLATTPPSHDDNPDGATHIQGFVVNMTAAGQNPKGPSAQGPPRLAPNMALSNQLRAAAPQPARFQGTCDACGQLGHQANTCDKVGAWDFLCHFHRNRGNSSLIDEAEKANIEKSKAFIKNDATTPKKVFTTYCELMGLTEDQVIDKNDWDFFLDDKERQPVFYTNSTIAEAHTSHINDDHCGGLTASPTSSPLLPDPFL